MSCPGCCDVREKERTLAEHSGETMLVQCDQCPGIRRHSRAVLIARFGGEARLSDVLPALCRPRRPDEPPHQPKLLGEHNEQN